MTKREKKKRKSRSYFVAAIIKRTAATENWSALTGPLIFVKKSPIISHHNSGYLLSTILSRFHNTTVKLFLKGAPIIFTDQSKVDRTPCLTSKYANSQIFILLSLSPHYYNHFRFSSFAIPNQTAIPRDHASTKSSCVNRRQAKVVKLSFNNTSIVQMNNDLHSVANVPRHLKHNTATLKSWK